MWLSCRILGTPAVRALQAVDWITANTGWAPPPLKYNRSTALSGFIWCKNLFYSNFPPCQSLSAVLWSSVTPITGHIFTPLPPPARHLTARRSTADWTGVSTALQHSTVQCAVHCAVQCTVQCSALCNAVLQWQCCIPSAGGAVQRSAGQSRRHSLLLAGQKLHGTAR